MEPIKRKRVTRVGSGAFSIYLPKKWMDTWAPNPDDNREVELHQVNEGLLIVPAHLERTFRAAVADDPTRIANVLMSAYVRGMDSCMLTPAEGPFGNDAVGAARDLMRHMDERLVATCQNDAIGFHLDGDLPPPHTDGAEILRAMATKTLEMMDLAAEAVDTFGHDPDRCLHAMGLLDAMQREDVQRLLVQALRSVARVELPMDAVSDFQFLDLLASHLERMGSHMLRMTDVLLGEYGLSRPDLEYPRRHLLEKIPKGLTVSGPGREMVIGYRRSFADIKDLLTRTLAAAADRNADALMQLHAQADHMHQAAGDAVFVAVAQHWGQETDEATARIAFAMSKIASLLSDLIHATQTLARHAALLTAAESSA